MHRSNMHAGMFECLPLHACIHRMHAYFQCLHTLACTCKDKHRPRRGISTAPSASASGTLWPNQAKRAAYRLKVLQAFSGFRFSHPCHVQPRQDTVWLQPNFLHMLLIMFPNDLSRVLTHIRILRVHFSHAGLYEPCRPQVYVRNCLVHTDHACITPPRGDFTMQ